MTNAIAFSLIVITTAGQVTYSSGYENLHMCMEARSLALTGQTLEDKAAQDAAKAAQDVAQSEIDIEAKWKLMEADTHKKPLFTCFAGARCDYTVNGGERTIFADDGSYSTYLSGGGFFADTRVSIEHDGTRNLYAPDKQSTVYSPMAFRTQDLAINNIKTAECVAREGGKP